MYLKIFMQWLARKRRTAWHTTIMRSGVAIMITLIVLLAGLALGWHAHRLGRFGQLKKQLKSSQPMPENVLKPGGKEIVKLERSPLLGNETPEFLSATLLPGRGMNIFQITAAIPQKGEINLLDSPPIAEAERRMSDSGTGVYGSENLAMGGAIELPWAGRIWGVQAGATNISVPWQDTRITVPADVTSRGSGQSVDGGLMLNAAAGTVTSSVMPDGGEAEGTFQMGDFDGHWPSQTAVSVSIQLSGHAIEMKVVARNTGNRPEPMGIGWAPRFAIASGHRPQVMLRLPQSEQVELKDRSRGQPSGRMVPQGEAQHAVSSRYGRRLGALDLNETFAHLRQGLMDSGSVTELRYPDEGFGLRMTTLTPTIKVLKIRAPAEGNFISIEPRFNLDDPFGRQWPAEEDTGMVILQPGQSAQWRVRLEIFSLDAERSAPTL